MKGPSHYVDVSSFGSRILTENLTRDDRLETTFNMATILNEIKAEKFLRDEVGPQIDKLRPDISKVYGIGIKSAASVYASYKYSADIPDSVKCDTVLYSSNNGVFDFPTIMSLLNAGIRVVMGGPTAMMTGPKQVREQLLQYGAKNLHNLIIVSGFVDLTTDLYNIVRNWKDTTIDSNDFSTIWECDKDFVQPYTNLFKRIRKHTRQFTVATIFKSGCWWGKCTFCTYGNIPIHSFVDNSSPETVAQNIISSCRLHETDRLFVADDYFLFTEFNEEVFKILTEHDIKIEIYSGIHLLRNPVYVKKIDKYIDSISLGIESFDNFSLKYINKGYTLKDINNALNNVIEYCSDLQVVMMLMMDLPIRSSSAIIHNYELIKEAREKLENNGLRVYMLPKLLEVNWNLRKTFLDNKYLRLADRQSKHISGRYVIWKALEELGIVDSDLYQDRTTPLERYDMSGNVLESDLFTISNDVFNGLTNES